MNYTDHPPFLHLDVKLRSPLQKDFLAWQVNETIICSLFILSIL